MVEWHQIFNAATLAAVPVPNSLATSRSAALVSVGVFDAINGIDRWYTPYLVKERAPARTSVDAATIQAAYAIPREALSRAGGVPDRAPDASIAQRDRRRACRCCAARDPVGPARRRHHMVSPTA